MRLSAAAFFPEGDQSVLHRQLDLGSSTPAKDGSVLKVLQKGKGSW